MQAGPCAAHPPTHASPLPPPPPRLCSNPSLIFLDEPTSGALLLLEGELAEARCAHVDRGCTSAACVCAVRSFPLPPAPPRPPVPPSRTRPGRLPGPERDGGAVDAGRQRAHGGAFLVCLPMSCPPRRRHRHRCAAAPPTSAAAAAAAGVASPPSTASPCSCYPPPPPPPAGDHHPPAPQLHLPNVRPAAAAQRGAHHVLWRGGKGGGLLLRGGVQVPRTGESERGGEGQLGVGPTSRPALPGWLLLRRGRTQRAARASCLERFSNTNPSRFLCSCPCSSTLATSSWTSRECCAALRCAVLCRVPTGGLCCDASPAYAPCPPPPPAFSQFNGLPHAGERGGNAAPHRPAVRPLRALERRNGAGELWAHAGTHSTACGTALRRQHLPRAHHRQAPERHLHPRWSPALQAAVVIAETSRQDMETANKDQQFANHLAREFSLLFGRAWRQASRNKMLVVSEGTWGGAWLVQGQLGLAGMVAVGRVVGSRQTSCRGAEGAACGERAGQVGCWGAAHVARVGAMSGRSARQLPSDPPASLCLLGSADRDAGADAADRPGAGLALQRNEQELCGDTR